MNDLAVRLKIELDAAQGTTALKRFESAFDTTLRKMGKSGEDIAAFKSLAKEVDSGAKKIEALDAETQQLYKTFRDGQDAAKALSLLGIEKSHAQIRAEIVKVKDAYSTLKTSGTLSQSELTQAAERTREKIAELRQSMSGVNAVSGGVSTGLGAVRNIVAAIGAAVAGSKILQYADEMQLLRGRLLLVEGSQSGVNRAMREISRIANETGTDIGAVGDTYFRFASAIQKVGGNSQQTVRFTEAVARALKLSGAGAEEAANTMRQLGQSLMKGKLDGDEFRSVAENGGLVLDYLAKALGKTRGELIQMSADGALTTKALLKLGDSLEKIRKDSENLPQTVGASMAKLTNAFKMWADQSTLVRGASTAVTRSLDGLADNFNVVASAVAGLTFAGLAAGAAALISRFGGLALAAGRFLIGLHPVGRAVIIAGSLIAAFADQIRDAWRAITASNADKAVNDLDSLQGALKKAGEAIRGEMGQGIEAANARIKSLGETYKTTSETIKQSLSDKLAAIQRSADAEKQAQDVAGGINQAQRIEAETNAVRAAGAQRVAIIRDSAAQQIAAADGTYSRLAELARMSGQNVAAIEQEGLRVRQDIYRQIEDAYRATIDRLIAEENRHLGEVRRIEDERARLKMSTEDRIRDLARSAMNDYAAYQDRLAQVDQKQAAARAALAQGNFDKAKQLAEEAGRLAEQSARAVQLPGQDGKMQVVVSQAQAASRAIGEIRQSAAIADQALAGLSGAHQKAADAAKTGADAAKTALADVESKLDAVKAQAAEGINLQLKADFAEADALVAKFKQQMENEKFLAKVEADIGQAKAALDAWRKDPENATLKMQAELALDGARKQMDTLQAEAVQRRIPLEFDFDAARKSFDVLKTELQAPTTSAHAVAADTRAAQAQIDALKQPTSSTHTVYVRQVEQRAMGGLIGAVQHLAVGGQVFRRQIGRIFGSGTSTSDSVPVMASAGEFMVRSASVRKYGVAFLDTINRGLLPETSIANMLAPAAQSVAARAERGQSSAEMKLTIHGPRGETVRVTSERDEARRLVRLLRNAGVKLS